MGLTCDGACLREGAEGHGGPILVGKLRHEEGCTMHRERAGMETLHHTGTLKGEHGGDNI